MRRAPACALLLLAGCGSTPASRLPSAAEPARSPELMLAPAGRVVEIGRNPEGLAADPRTGLVAVSLRNPDRVVLVDGSEGRVTRRVAVVESGRHLALEKPGGPVLVPAERAGALVRVTLPDGAVTSAPVGEFPHAAAAAAGRTFVGNEGEQSVTVLEGQRRVAELPVALQPGSVVAADRGRAVGVVSVRARVLELFDARTLARIASAPAGVGPTHAVADADRIYVVDTQGDAVLVFRLRPRLQLTRRITLPGTPYGIAIDPGRERLWVTLTATNQVAELHTGGRARVRRMRPTVRQPNTVAADPATGRVFIASRSDGVLQILEP